MAETQSSSLMDGLPAADSAGPSRPARSRGVRQAAALGFALLSLVVLGVVLTRAVQSHSNSPSEMSKRRTLVDAQTGEVFAEHAVSLSETVPFTNPKTGNRTLFPAEACYWTKDGGAKLQPTYVLLNEAVGKTGPTTCPDCGRKVIFHNPLPPAEVMLKASQRGKS